MLAHRYMHTVSSRGGSRWDYWRALFGQGLTGYSVRFSRSTEYRLCFAGNYKGDWMFCWLSLNGTDSTGSQLGGCRRLVCLCCSCRYVKTHTHTHTILTPRGKHIQAELDKSSSSSCVHLDTFLLDAIIVKQSTMCARVLHAHSPVKVW